MVEPLVCSEGYHRNSDPRKYGQASLWGEENKEDEDRPDDGDLNDDVVVEDNALDTARLRGQLVRNNMLRNMPPIDNLSLRADSLHTVTQTTLESAVANLYSH